MKSKYLVNKDKDIEGWEDQTTKHILYKSSANYGWLVQVYTFGLVNKFTVLMVSFM